MPCTLFQIVNRRKDKNSNKNKEMVYLVGFRTEIFSTSNSNVFIRFSKKKDANVKKCFGIFAQDTKKVCWNRFFIF